MRDLVAAGYAQGQSVDYNQDVALSVPQLMTFLQATQPKVVTELNLGNEGIQRTQFLHRLQGEIAKRGVVDVLRKGVSHGLSHVDLYRLLPTPGITAADEAFAKNVFSVTRQVRYSPDEAQRALESRCGGGDVEGKAVAGSASSASWLTATVAARAYQPSAAAPPAMVAGDAFPSATSRIWPSGTPAVPHPAQACPGSAETAAT